MSERPDANEDPAALRFIVQGRQPTPLPPGFLPVMSDLYRSLNDLGG